MMNTRFLLASCAIGVATLYGTPSADANSRFTVNNKSDADFKMYVYSGGDKACFAEQKIKRVSSGNERSFGCAGNGTNSCKVTIFADGNSICRYIMDSCNKDTVRIANKSTITVVNDGNGSFDCWITK